MYEKIYKEIYPKALQINPSQNFSTNPREEKNKKGKHKTEQT